MSVEQAVADQRIVVCVGPGGVGKTSCAAALGLRQARRGRRVLVLTIDPARRLAAALGLSGQLGSEAHPIPWPGGLAGSLHGMMLDVRATFDGLVQRYAPSPSVARRILRNGFYDYLAGSLPGGQEYMAVERLYEVLGSGRYDLVVVDTPPAANALDFLDAPQRMLDAIDSRALRFLFAPYAAGGGSGFGFFSRGGGLLSKTVARVVGAEMVASMAEFIGEFQSLYEGFRARARSVSAELAQDSTGFVLVVSPASVRLGEAGAFLRSLQARGFRLRGLIANRVRPGFPIPDAELAHSRPERWLSRLPPDACSPATARGLLTAALRLEALAAADREALAALEQDLDAGVPVAHGREGERDLTDLRGLAWLEEELFGPEESR